MQNPSFELRPAKPETLPRDLGAVHSSEGGEVYTVAMFNSEGYEETARGRMLWLAQVNRGGVCFGGGAVWTDASSPEDCVRRVLTDAIIN